MKDIVIIKDKTKADMFDEDDRVINVMSPSNFKPSKLGLGPKTAFLYKGFPMYFDRTVIHARKEDKMAVQELFAEAWDLSESYKVGDNVHLGFGTKGGAGFIGKIEKLEGDTVHIKNDKGKTYKGHVDKLSKLDESKLSNDDLAKEVRRIKQHMINKGITRPDDQVKHLHKDDHDAAIHGIVHGTNTLGFQRHLKSRKINEANELPNELAKKGRIPFKKQPAKGDHVDFYHNDEKHYGQVTRSTKDGKIHIKHSKTGQIHKFDVVSEAVDEHEAIRNEYKALTKKSIQELRNHIKANSRVIDASEFRTKDQAATHILTNKHGRKRFAKAMGLDESFETPSLLDRINNLRKSFRRD